MIEKCVFRRREFKAVQWTGNNYDEIVDLIGDAVIEKDQSDEEILYIGSNIGIIKTTVGYYIVQNKLGDLYVFDEDFFEDNFEEMV